MSKKVRKINNNGPRFEMNPFKSTGIRYNKMDMYSSKVVAHNVKYSDLYNYVEKQRKKLAKNHPSAKMNIAIKYRSMSKPISAGYFDVSGESDLIAPYDYQDEDDNIDAIYIQVAGI